MIAVKVSKDSVGNVITKLEITGHAGYDVAGKDIVCSAVSTAVQLTTHTLQLLVNVCVKVTDDEHGVTIDVGRYGYDRAVMCVMNAFFEFMIELERQYPSNIAVMIDRPTWLHSKTEGVRQI